MKPLIPIGPVRSAILACALAAVGCSAEERAWQSAEKRGTVAAYEQFLRQHAGSARANAALEKIWSLVEQTNTVMAYERFLQLHGEAEALSQRAVAAIWKLTVEKGSTEAYEHFLANHGSSKEAAAALQALWRRAAAEHTIPAYVDFLAKHPQSSFAEKATRALAGLWTELTPEPPDCTLTSTPTVDVTWLRVKGATNYLVESSPLPTFPAAKIQSTEANSARAEWGSCISRRYACLAIPAGEPANSTGPVLSANRLE